MTTPAPIELTEKQVRMARAAALRFMGKTQSEVADELGVSERTIRNYEHDPQFAELLQLSMRAELKEVGQLVLFSLRGAVKALHSALNDEDAKVQIAAAKAILSEAPRWMLALGVGDLAPALPGDGDDDAPALPVPTIKLDVSGKSIAELDELIGGLLERSGADGLRRE